MRKRIVGFVLLAVVFFCCARVVEALCSVSVDPASLLVTQEAGGLTLEVTTGSECPWLPGSEAAWITFGSVVSESFSYGYYRGTGSVEVLIGENAGCDSRTGTVVLADAVFTVAQGAVPWTIDPAEYAGPREGGVVDVNVTAAEACDWFVSTDIPWIGLSGHGNYLGYSELGYGYRGGARIELHVFETDVRTERSGVVLFRDHVFQVTQERGRGRGGADFFLLLNAGEGEE